MSYIFFFIELHKFWLLNWWYLQAGILVKFVKFFDAEIPLQLGIPDKSPTIEIQDLLFLIFVLSNNRF